MAATFQNSALTTTYTGGSDIVLVGLLQKFRNGTGLGSNPDLAVDIEALDRRIATFESVLFTTPANNGGNASGEYPYDEAGMKREFLDEVTALLLRRSVTANGLSFESGAFIDTTKLSTASADFAAGEMLNLRKGDNYLNLTGGHGFNNFADLTVTSTSDPRRTLLNDDGKRVYDRYVTLINEVFAEGARLANLPSRPVQVVAGIPGLVIDGVSYHQVATESDILTSTTSTYLLEAGAPLSDVSKGATGTVTLTGPSSTTAQRLLLDPKPANPVFGTLLANVDGANVVVNAPSTGGFILSVGAASQSATAIEPIFMPVPGQADGFPQTHLKITHSVSLNGIPYLVGKTTSGQVYVMSVAAAKRQSINTTATLSSIQYLYFFNEARIKILRAKLAYNEAVVREIQDDLKRANEALADLEAQSGKVQATDKDGNPTGQYSAETFKMNMFNATNSPAGQPIFSEAGPNSLHTATDWQENRTNLKNYIDRRSAEAQQATLDYQNVLNRFNNAFEVMGKLQEKLDTLLKAQLRNMG